MSALNHPHEINRDYIRLLQVMRRFVQEEFKVAIRMTQEDAVAQLLHYAALSRNHVLQEMGHELREFTGSPSPAAASAREEAEEERQMRYYRGVAVAVEESSTEGKEEPQERRPTRIYRGRAVSA